MLNFHVKYLVYIEISKNYHLEKLDSYFQIDSNTLKSLPIYELSIHL